MQKSNSGSKISKDLASPNVRLSERDKLLIEILKDPVKWAEFELNTVPRWYQADILRDPSKRIVMRCARRLGKSFTIAIHMLWHAFTTKNATCLYVAPSDAQISQQFDDIDKLIDGSNGLKNSIVKRKKNPYYIKLGNGSIIKGITAGTKSGSKGFALRGQKATWLYVDEMDYLADDDWNSIAPIFMEAPKRIGVTVSSTPTGKRGVYYNLCFVPGTQITVGDGTQRNIEDLHIGQNVMTHLGRNRKIERTFVHDYNGDLYNIKFKKLKTSNLKCTPEHPFYVYRNDQYQWVPANELRDDDYCLVPDSNILIKDVLSNEEAELLGYYLNNGKILLTESDNKYVLADEYRRYGIRFSTNNENVPDKIAKLVDKAFGIKRIKVDGRVIEIYSSELANRIYDLAPEKHTIPNFITYGKEETVRSFLSGYFSYRTNMDKEITFCTPKPHTSSIFSMLLRLGIAPRVTNTRITSYTTQEDVNAITVSREDFVKTLGSVLGYKTVEFSQYKVKESKESIKNGYLFVQISSITTEPYNGKVHNIQVEEDNSYLANMIAVHNCTDKARGFKEFHHQIMIHPEWSPDMEKELRSIFSSDIAWEHEELAEFGTEVTGVWDKRLLDAARQEYKYIRYPDYHAIRCIGVDWDKYGAETQIVVMEFVQSENKFKIINRVAIPRSEFTLDNGVEKIKELNAIYNPAYIYVDRGYGEHQIETLHKFGLDHPETGLSKKVKGIAFNQSIEVKDPFTKLASKKPFKHFMIDQFGIQLERDRIILCDDDIDVWRDLQNYNIVRYTSSGSPVFTNKDEHTVDATLLALVAFIIEMPKLGGTISGMNLARHTVKTNKEIYSDPLSKKDGKRIDDDYDKAEKNRRLVKVPVGSKKKSGSSGFERGDRFGMNDLSRRKW